MYWNQLTFGNQVQNTGTDLLCTDSLLWPSRKDVRTKSRKIDPLPPWPHWLNHFYPCGL